jgi:hypothetical protein
MQTPEENLRGSLFLLRGSQGKILQESWTQSLPEDTRSFTETSQGFSFSSQGFSGQNPSGELDTEFTRGYPELHRDFFFIEWC